MSSPVPIPVLISTSFTAEQIARVTAAHPRVKMLSEAGGTAIVNPADLPFRPLDYPRDRPDLDVEALLAEAEVVIAARVPRDLMVRAKRLRWLHLTSAGVDHLWNPALDESDIIVTKASMHGIPLAEFALFCMLLFARKATRIQDQQRRRHWEKFLVDELCGGSVLLLGLGEIGGTIAARCKAFGMEVVGMRLTPGRSGVPDAVDRVIGTEELKTAAAAADYVVSSLPSTPRTRGLVDASVLAAMKPSAVFINVGRGATVDQPALVEALRSGRIAGAGLDVYTPEPLPPDHPLWDLPNVFLSPHMAADTPMYTERSTRLFCENLRRYAEGLPLLHRVNRSERY